MTAPPVSPVTLDLNAIQARVDAATLGVHEARLAFDGAVTARDISDPRTIIRVRNAWSALELAITKEAATPLIREVQALREEIERLTAERDALDGELRTQLALGHGHTGLYLDDGEMQCGECRLDFRRDPLDRIRERLREVKFPEITGAMNLIAENARLTADHAALRTVVREWQEAYKLFYEGGDPKTDPFGDPLHAIRSRLADDALASHPLKEVP